MKNQIKNKQKKNKFENKKNSNQIKLISNVGLKLLWTLPNWVRLS